jgi:hypothetical protein
MYHAGCAPEFNPPFEFLPDLCYRPPPQGR